MSYKIDKRDDSLNELFGMFADFEHVSQNLLEADKSGMESFVVWFGKLMDIDRRMTFFFIRKNKGKLSDRSLKLAQSYFTEVF